MNFGYYYGDEAEQFTFYRIPKKLIKDDAFKKISSDAKLLYGLMLDRMSLSIKNRWIDEENRVFIHFSIADIMDEMNCARQKAVKLLDELDAKSGIGLIERKRLGMGKVNVIYIKNFLSYDQNERNQDEEAEASEAKSLEAKPSEAKIEEIGADKPQETAPAREEGDRCGNQTSRSMKIKLQEVRKLNFKKYENQTSRSMKIKSQEVRQSNPNKNNMNDTEWNKNIYNPSIYQPGRDGWETETIEFYREMLEENIGYANLCLDYPLKKRNINELMKIMLDVICSAKKMIKVNGEYMPIDVVKQQFLQIRRGHIEYVLMSLGRSATDIKNMKNYLISTLYNAPMTVINSIDTLVRHDSINPKQE